MKFIKNNIIKIISIFVLTWFIFFSLFFILIHLNLFQKLQNVGIPILLKIALFFGVAWAFAYLISGIYVQYKINKIIRALKDNGLIGSNVTRYLHKFKNPFMFNFEQTVFKYDSMDICVFISIPIDKYSYSTITYSLVENEKKFVRIHLESESKLIPELKEKLSDFYKSINN